MSTFLPLMAVISGDSLIHFVIVLVVLGLVFWLLNYLIGAVGLPVSAGLTRLPALSILKSAAPVVFSILNASAVWAAAPVSALKRVDLPAFGRPTIPTFTACESARRRQAGRHGACRR